MRAAVCLFVRDEERDIAEWLAFQFAVGFDAVILYDNGSVDRTAEIAQRFLWKHLPPVAVDAAVWRRLSTWGNSSPLRRRGEVIQENNPRHRQICRNSTTYLSMCATRNSSYGPAPTPCSGCLGNVG
jgi:hypothetical protein